MEDLFGVGKIIELVEKKFGPFWGGLLTLAVGATLFAGAVHFFWIWLVEPMGSFLAELLEGGPLVTVDNIGPIVSTVVVVVTFLLLTSILIPLVRNLTRHRAPQAAIDSLAELRSEGIRILNDRPANETGLPDWRQRWNAWAERVVKTLERDFTQAESLGFRRLGLIEERTFGFAVNPEHNHYLMQLAKQLTILENLIERHLERR